MNEYIKQGNDFLTETNTTLKTILLGTFEHFSNDKEKRDVYEVILSNPNHVFTFRFGDSLANTEKRVLSRFPNNPKFNPTSYDILACLQAYEVGSFKDFCDNFGYNNDSFEAFNTYKDVCNEYENLKKLFSNAQLEQLQEIN